MLFLIQTKVISTSHVSFYPAYYHLLNTCDVVLYGVSFYRDVLLNQELVDFLESRGCLCWGVNVNSEEGTHVSYTLQESTYSFLALVMLKGTRMTIIWRQEGEFSPPL